LQVNKNIVLLIAFLTMI